MKYIGTWSIEKLVTGGYYLDTYTTKRGVTYYNDKIPKIITYRIRDPDNKIRGQYIYYNSAQAFIRRMRYPFNHYKRKLHYAAPR